MRESLRTWCFPASRQNVFLLLPASPLKQLTGMVLACQRTTSSSKALKEERLQFTTTITALPSSCMLVMTNNLLLSSIACAEGGRWRRKLEIWRMSGTSGRPYRAFQELQRIAVEDAGSESKSSVFSLNMGHASGNRDLAHLVI